MAINQETIRPVFDRHRGVFIAVERAVALIRTRRIASERLNYVIGRNGIGHNTLPALIIGLNSVSGGSWPDRVAAAQKLWYVANSRSNFANRRLGSMFSCRTSEPAVDLPKYVYRSLSGRDWWRCRHRESYALLCWSCGLPPSPTLDAAEGAPTVFESWVWRAGEHPSFDRTSQGWVFGGLRFFIRRLELCLPAR